MEQRHFLSVGSVRQHVECDDGLSSAIQSSREFYPQFCATFSQPAIWQHDFIVTVVEECRGHLEPIGIAVDHLDDSLIQGRRLVNRCTPQVAGPATCTFDQVVDVRYTDTFECEGGFLYKELYQRQPQQVRNRIWSKLPFLPEWNSDTARDPQFHEYLRHIANRRCTEALETVVRDPSLADRLGYMPRPGHGRLDRRVVLIATTSAQYAAEFGNREMIFTLHRAGVLAEDREARTIVR